MWEHDPANSLRAVAGLYGRWGHDPVNSCRRRPVRQTDIAGCRLSARPRIIKEYHHMADYIRRRRSHCRAVGRQVLYRIPHRKPLRVRDGDQRGQHHPGQGKPIQETRRPHQLCARQQADQRRDYRPQLRWKATKRTCLPARSRSWSTSAATASASPRSTSSSRRSRCAKPAKSVLKDWSLKDTEKLIIQALASINGVNYADQSEAEQGCLAGR